MDSSVGSTIEKIKLQEHDKEAKLREKRTFEATLIALSRNVRECSSRAAKLREECAEAATRADALDAARAAETVRRQALAGQLDQLHKELCQLKATSEHGVSNVWKLRNSLCKEVQNVSDHCDVWALITKPKYIDTTRDCNNSTIHENTEQNLKKEDALEAATVKREHLLAERDRLVNEPDSGDDFIRIKNAIRYSMEMTAHINE